MEDEKKIGDIQVGDEVIVREHIGNRKRIARVTRITPTQIVVGNSRYKKSGRKIGAHAWDDETITVPTESDRLEVYASQAMVYIKEYIPKLNNAEIIKLADCLKGILS